MERPPAEMGKPEKTGEGNENSIHLKCELPNNPSAYTSLEFSKLVRLEV